MIEGLMLTIPGEELRRLLEQRVDEHQRAPIGGSVSRCARPRNQRTTGCCCQSTFARTKRSGTNGVPPFWDSFATVSNPPRSIDWAKRISRSASCCQKSPDIFESLNNVWAFYTADLNVAMLARIFDRRCRG
jgi:hypothetical protein